MNLKNNFDVVRLILALIVLLVHSSEVTKNINLNFLSNYLNSGFAVKGFFSISGFLIAKSFIRSRNLKSYFLKRAKRILPAYILTIASCFVIGLLITNLSINDFILNKDTVRYLFSNLFFMNFIQPSLPGVFINNPMQAMDGSLWTIKGEISLYLIIPIVIPFLIKKPALTISIILIISNLWFFYFSFIFPGVKGAIIAKQFIYLSGFFFFGSLFALNDFFYSKLKYITIISMFFYFLFKSYDLGFIFEVIAFPSVVIYFCTDFCREIKISRVGDLSYGMYLYHWPLIQLFQYYGFFDESPCWSLFSLILLTLIISFFSWNLFENKFLKRG